MYFDVFITSKDILMCIIIVCCCTPIGGMFTSFQDVIIVYGHCVDVFVTSEDILIYIIIVCFCTPIEDVCYPFMGCLNYV